MNYYYPYNLPFRPMPNPNIFSRLGRSFGTIKRINWSNIINNTSKTLGVINQAIPIVKQTGPMLHNMRSMLKVASAFKNETSNKKQKKETITNNQDIKKEVITDNNHPNFFI